MDWPAAVLHRPRVLRFVRLRSSSLALPIAFHVLGNSFAIVQRLY